MLQHLLRLSRHSPPVTMDTVAREAFSEALLQELHAFANGLMAEGLEHFRVPALSNDLVHVFRRRDGTGGIVGFQFWKAGLLSGMPRSRVIIGGKLRIHPAFRQRGLHLPPGLTAFLQANPRHPPTPPNRLPAPPRAAPTGCPSPVRSASCPSPRPCPGISPSSPDPGPERNTP